MNLNFLRALLLIAEKSSISAAARELEISQPVLTRGLKRFEQEMGAKLLLRSPKGVVLTEAGSALVQRARTIEAEARRAQEEVAQINGIRSGSVALAASPVPMKLIVPQALALFRQRFPLVHTRVAELVYPLVVQAFRENRVDFAVGPALRSGLGPGFKVEPLFAIDLAVAVRAGHPSERVQSLAELQEQDWIISGPQQGPGDVLEQVFVAQGLKVPRCAMHCDTVGAAVDVIANTDLIGVVPRPIALEAERRGLITVLKLEEHFEPLLISLFMPSGSNLTPAAGALVSAIRSFARGYGAGV